MKPSQHIGKPGGTITRELHLIKAMEFTNDEYTRWFHKFHDEWGNAIVWWGSHLVRHALVSEHKGAELVAGECIEAEFTVKDHDVYGGELQTIVTHLHEALTEEQKRAERAERKGIKRAELIAAGICPDCKDRRTVRGKVCKTCEGGW